MSNITLTNTLHAHVPNEPLEEADPHTQKIITALAKVDRIRGEERENIIKCIFPFLNKLVTDDQIQFAIEVLAPLHEEERMEIIDSLLPIIDRLESGYQIAHVIRQLGGIPVFERKNVMHCMLLLINQIQPSQIESILQGLAAIPNEKREAVSICLLPFVDRLKDRNLTVDICQCLAKVSDEERENISSYILHSLPRLNDMWIARLLDTLSKTQDSGNIVRCLHIFDRKLQTGLQIQSMVQCLDRISVEERENVIQCGWNLFASLHSTEIEPVLKVLSEIPTERRDSCVDCVFRHISRLGASDIAPTLEVLAEIPEETMEKVFDDALTLVDTEISEGANVKPAWVLLAKHEKFLRLFNHITPEFSGITSPKPETMQSIVQYLEQKGSIPAGRCIISENIQFFQQQFTRNQKNFDQPLSFLISSKRGLHWQNITVQNKCVISSDSTWVANASNASDIEMFFKDFAPGYKFRHIPLHRQAGYVGCWAFALRDAVELLRLKDIQILVGEDGQVSIPTGLFKSMQSISFFNDSPILNQNVQSRNKGIERVRKFEYFLNQNKKIKNKKPQNCYIDERREKYKEILFKGLPSEQPEQECSVSAFMKKFPPNVKTIAVTHAIDRKNLPVLQHLLPLVAKNLPIPMLLKASSLIDLRKP